MRHARGLGFLAASVLLASSTGCLAAVRNVIPAATPAPGDESSRAVRVLETPDDVLRSKGAHRKASCFVAVDDATLGVTAVDSQPTLTLLSLPVVAIPFIPLQVSRARTTVPRPVRIEVRVTAEADGYTFDPLETELVTSDGRAHRPTRSHGPVVDNGWWTCSPRPQQDAVAVPPAPHPVPRFHRRSVYASERACYQLWFDAEWDLAAPPRLLVRGLRREGAAIAVPPFRFERAVRWEFIALP